MNKLLPAIPVTVVSGFLGSGKTTLLNHLIKSNVDLRIAVMVNDFGAINIDKDLIVAETDTMVSLANGCICCTVESDLIQQLSKLLSMKENRPEYIVIEASGVSNPSKIANTLRYPEFRGRLTIDSILTVVDAEQFSTLDNELAQLAMEQLDVADIVVLNKVDQATPEQIESLKKQWLYPGVRLLETQFGKVPLELVLGVKLFKQTSHSIAQHQCDEHCSHDHDHNNSHSHDHPHHNQDHGIQFDSWSWTSDQTLSLPAVRQLIAELPASIYRAKGILSLKEVPQKRVVMNVVGSRNELEPDSLWGETAPSNQLVFIGLKDQFDLADLQAKLDRCIVA